MTVGFWVIAFVILLIVGNLMAAKPKIHEVRLGEFRLLARKKGLNPKLIATPEWLKNNQKLTQNQKTSMITQYTLVNDNWRNPLMHFIFDGQTWHNLGDVDFFVRISPPDNLSPYFVGMLIKANSISLYWRDESYLQKFSVRENISTTMEHDLTALSDYLSQILSVDA